MKANHNSIFTRSISIVLAAVLAISCIEKTDPLLVDTEDREPAPITIDIDVAPSRSIVSGTALPAESRLGVFLSEPNKNTYEGNSFHNVPYTNGSSGSRFSFAGETAQEPMLTSVEGVLTAYYPYHSSTLFDNPTALPITVNEDYLYAQSIGGLSNQSSSISLHMRHALSVVQFNISTSHYDGEGILESVSVAASNLGSSALLNATTGVLGEVGGLGEEITVRPNIALSAKAKPVYVLVVPSDAASECTFRFSVDGRLFTVQSVISRVCQGNRYIYDVVVEGTDISLSSCTMNSWDDHFMGEDEDYSFEGYARVGDYVYSDGTFSVGYDTTKTCIGLVFWVDPDDRTHYKVVALDNQVFKGLADYTYNYTANTAKAYPYIDNTTATSAYINGGQSGTSTPRVAVPGTTVGAIADYNGAANFKCLKDAYGEGHIMTFVKQYGNNEWKYGKTGEWYLPSLGEMSQIYLNRSKLNANFTAAGAQAMPLTQTSSTMRYYATSTVAANFGTIKLWTLRMNDGYVTQTVYLSTSGKYCCPVMEVRSNQTKVGDILYSDGSISSGCISTKTPIGVVFHLDKGFPVHGKAIALEDAGTTYWSRDYMLMNGCTTTTLFDQAVADNSGQTNCENIAYDLREDYCAAEVCIDYGNASWSAQFRIGMWYLPTFGELYEVYENIEAVGDGIYAAGGRLTDGEYWTSTQANARQAWWHSLYVDDGNMGDYEYHTKNERLNVRAVVAF